MKKLNVLTKMLLLFALVVGSTSVWGETVTFTAGTDKGNAGEPCSVTKDGITISFSEGTFSRDDNYRCYSGASMTISSSVGNMTSIAFVATSGNPMTKFSGNPDVGSWTKTSDTNWTWNGEASEINFGTTSGQCRITSILVTYTPAQKEDPTITFNNGSVRVGKTLDLSTLFTSNSLGAVTYSITAGDSYASRDGSVLTGVAEGSVTVQASQAAAGKYNAKSVTATITVNPALVLSSIAVTTAPDKTSYFVGDVFDATGMVVTATYTDATQEDVTASCTLTPTTALTIEDTEITISYTENAVEKTTTQAITVNPISDYVILPFNWEGGGKAALVAINGITTSSLDGDYAAGNAPYLVKFNGDGKYITIKTGSQPGKIYVDIKKIGGPLTSTLKIQESSDGESFTDVEELYTFGDNNAVVDLETTKPFNEDSRYVRIYFLKKYNNETGSNVGVGPITITSVEGVKITDAQWASFSSTKPLDFSNTGITAYIATQNNTNSVSYEEVTKIPANTGLILYSDVNATTTINVPIATSATFEGTNLLVSTANGAHVITSGEVATDRYYVFGKVDSEIGFVKAAANYEIGTSKAYLVLPSGGAKDFIGLPGNEAEETEVTGITEVEKIKKAENGIVYNLAGQRVSNPIKGLYIINGKKVIIK